jgi:hypothetical protein
LLYMEMWLAIGPNGWAEVALPEKFFGRRRLYVRFQPEPNGRLAVHEMFFDGEGAALTGKLLRQLPLSDVEAWANNPAVAEIIKERLNHAGPDIALLASHYATAWEPAERHWLAQAVRAGDYKSAAHKSQPEKTRQRRESATLQPKRTPPPPLTPPEDGLTDDFLTKVAAAYDYAISLDRAPAERLSKQAQVSTRTVHRWIYTARKRGIMNSGKQGTVG